jgi:hypothetical protein
MANSEIAFKLSGEARDGNNPRMFDCLRNGDQTCGAWSPAFFWVCPITYETLRGTAATHTITLTIPASGLVDGTVSLRLVGTDTAGAAVDVTASADFDTDEDGTAAALEAVIETLRGTTLATVVSGETVTDNVITVEILAGALVTPTFTYTPAPLYEAVWSGTLQDNVSYGVRITEDGEDPVDTYVTRAGGSPANVAAMAVAMEAALEASALLTTILTSADDDGVDTNAIQFAAGVEIDDVEAVYVGRVQTFEAVFGGTIVDGAYVLSFVHPSLPNVDGPNQVDITVTRAAGTPADEAALAVAMEAAVEASPLLAALIASADDDTVDTNDIVAASGVEGLEITGTAPGTATLVVTETTPEITVTDETPAGPTLVLANTIVVDCNSIEAFPGVTEEGGEPVCREWVTLYVSEAFGANRTITIGDAGNPDGVMGTTPITLNSTGYTASSSSDAEYQPRPEANWVPTATIQLGSSMTLTAGACSIRVLYSPEPAVPTPE